VCSGIGRYFDADPVWFRIAFLVALFIFGSSVLVYLVLWIIIPPANTTAEKLEMRGEKMNLKNIEQNIREEFEELKKKYHDKKWRKPRTREEIRNFKRRMHELKREMRTSRSRVAAEADTTGRRIAGVFENLLYYFVKVVLMFVGLLLLALGIAITVGLIISLTGSENYFMISQWGIRTVSLPAFTSLIFDTELQGTLALTGLGLLLGVPLAMMIIGGFRLVLGYKNRIRLLSLTATCLWLAGLFLTLYSGFMMYRSFRDKAAVKEEIAITAPENKILYLDVPKTYYLPDADDDTKNTLVFNNIYFVADEFATRNYGYHKLRIVPGDTGEYMLTVHKSAMGKNIPLARKRAANIAFHAHQADSVIWIDNHFTLPEGEKWRNQKVTLTLKVPEGQVIHLRRNMEMLLHRSDQADDTWSDEMIGKNMIMTAGGLKLE
jgi:phage shock protein PspC (stress-responsive transcriptional regulator)